MRMNRNKDLGINMRIYSKLIFACALFCLGAGAPLFLKTGLRQLRYRVAIHG